MKGVISGKLVVLKRHCKDFVHLAGPEGCYRVEREVAIGQFFDGIPCLYYVFFYVLDGVIKSKRRLAGFLELDFGASGLCFKRKKRANVLERRLGTRYLNSFL